MFAAVAISGLFGVLVLGILGLVARVAIRVAQSIAALGAAHQSALREALEGAHALMRGMGEDHIQKIERLSASIGETFRALIGASAEQQTRLLQALDARSHIAAAERAQDMREVRTALEHSTSEIAHTREVLRSLAGQTNGRAG